MCVAWQVSISVMTLALMVSPGHAPGNSKRPSNNTKPKVFGKVCALWPFTMSNWEIALMIVHVLLVEW